MAKPVDKACQIRYNFYDILIYFTYLIIPRMEGSLGSAFLFLDRKNGAIAPVVIIHLLLLPGSSCKMHACPSFLSHSPLCKKVSPQGVSLTDGERFSYTAVILLH